jgi:glyoxylate/hydroxypyruvate reductase A
MLMHVLIADALAATPEFAEALRLQTHDVQLTYWQRDLPPPTADVLAVWTLPDDMHQLPEGLKAVFCFGAGAGHLLTDSRIAEHLPVVRNLDHGQAEQMLDYALHAVLARQLDDQRLLEAQRLGVWDKPKQARRPRGDLKVTVLGHGHIGRHVSAGIAAYGFRVTSWTLRSGEPVPGLIRGRENIVQACDGADVVINVLPPLPGTEDILSERLISCVAGGSYLINIGRGQHLDESTLIAALDSGHLGAAWLDTFRREPLPQDHPFWRHPKVRVTPHVGGLPTVTGSAKALANVLDALRTGAPLPGLLKNLI